MTTTRPAPRQTMGTSTIDRIEVRGHDLCDELIGRISFTDMIAVETLGRFPTEQERTLLDAVLTVTEHGLTPSSLAARLAFTGAPESPQGAVAAGLIGAGSVYLGAMHESAILLRELAAPSVDRAGRIREVVTEAAAGKRSLPGIGHPIHRDGDPRVPRLFAVADSTGQDTLHRQCLLELRDAGEEMLGRSLPINAAGAIAAILSDAGLPVELCRGLAIIGRAAGLVGHLVDEDAVPTGRAVWLAAEQAVAYADPRQTQTNTMGPSPIVSSTGSHRP